MTWHTAFDTGQWAGSKNVQGCVDNAWNTYGKYIARAHNFAPFPFLPFSFKKQRQMIIGIYDLDPKAMHKAMPTSSDKSTDAAS